MLTPIPIHNLSPYAVVSLTNLTLGSFFIANHIYQNWLRKINLTLLDTNALVKGLMIILGFAMINPEKLFNGSLSFQLACFFIGCIFGFLYFKFEAWIINFLPQNPGFQSEQIPRKSNNIKNILNKKPTPVVKNSIHESYLSAGIVGVFEEILFRGFLTVICLGLPNIFIAISCILLISIIFALSHINLGYQHVLTKFVLGSVCLIVFLLSGSISASIATHLTFNILAIKRIREFYND